MCPCVSRPADARSAPGQQGNRPRRVRYYLATRDLAALALALRRTDYLLVAIMAVGHWSCCSPSGVAVGSHAGAIKQLPVRRCTILPCRAAISKRRAGGAGWRARLLVQRDGTSVRHGSGTLLLEEVCNGCLAVLRCAAHGRCSVRYVSGALRCGLGARSASPRFLVSRSRRARPPGSCASCQRGSPCSPMRDPGRRAAAVLRHWCSTSGQILW